MNTHISLWISIILLHVPGIYMYFHVQMYINTDIFSIFLGFNSFNGQWVHMVSTCMRKERDHNFLKKSTRIYDLAIFYHSIVKLASLIYIYIRLSSSKSICKSEFCILWFFLLETWTLNSTCIRISLSFHISRIPVFLDLF